METVIFDPSKLNLEQKDFLLNKLESVSAAPDADGCRKFKPRSRHGKAKNHGSMKIRSDISKMFGMKDRNYDASKLMYCVKKNIPMTKNDEECSHLCGFGLCMSIEHLTIEPHSINTSRTDHHEFGYCDSDHNGYKSCIIKTAEFSYDPWQPDD